VTKPGRLHLLAVAMVLLFATGDSSAQPSSTPVTGGNTARQPLPAADLRAQQPVVGDAKVGVGKAVVCSACHGPNGVAIAPNFPNLAGQSATYLYIQLKEFKDGHRRDPIMSGQAAALSEEDMRNIASYYASLAPKAAGASDSSSAGGQLFLSGNPARGIPPCQGCHGPTGLGPQVIAVHDPQPPWSTYPRLRGQSVLYLNKALKDFRSGARVGNTNAKVMQGVATTLDDNDVQALATYLSTL